jgi:hypothetical protein
MGDALPECIVDEGGEGRRLEWMYMDARGEMLGDLVRTDNGEEGGSERGSEGESEGVSEGGSERRDAGDDDDNGGVVSIVLYLFINDIIDVLCSSKKDSLSIRSCS